MKHGPKWLLDELPRMEAHGVIDAATAARLREYCAERTGPARSWTRPLLGAFGGLLVGFGVVLLVAHNWDGMPLAARMTIAFSPLLVGQLACLWALTGARDSRAWREGAGAFTALAFTAALALVGQIFHLGGDLDRFLLTCAVMALPLAYLLRAVSVVVLCGLALFGWVMAAGGVPPLAVAVAYMALAPPLWWARTTEARIDLGGQLGTTLTVPMAVTAMALSLSAALAPEAAALWAALALGITWLCRDAQGRPLLAPLSLLGLSGLGMMAAAATFADFWGAGGWPEDAEASLPGWTLLLAALLLFVGLLVRAIQRGQWHVVAASVPVLWVGGAVVLDLPVWGRMVAMTLANTYALGMGLSLLHLGLQRSQLRLAHAGLVIVGALVLIRFFDTALPFTVRGVAFVAVGLGFMAASAWLRRRVVQP